MGHVVMPWRSDYKSEVLRHLDLKEPLRVSRTDSLGNVIERMQEERRACVLVCDGDRLVGIFTERDVLLEVVGRGEPSDAPIERFMTPDPMVLSLDDTIGTAVARMDTGGYRNIPLVDGEGKVAGLVSVRDILTFLAEHFPEEVYNLPPRLHQAMERPEGA
ncbi:MAG: CBS domain-containing protein [Deltaproteobacteria bacterium]|nr:MAG: CBS domain-containing protein [Deltaproteobacteria bacterium]